MSIRIEDLTIGQAREISALLGTTTSRQPPLVARLVGRAVVVRSHLSGVWWGRLEAVGEPQGSDVPILLSGARRAWYWTGAGSVSGLARRGPSGGKIAGPVTVQIPAHVEICESTPEADAAWAALPEWTGRE